MILVCLVAMWPFGFIDLGSSFWLWTMDSYHSSGSSSSMPAKLCYCLCGKRMSTLTYDFHSICVNCCGIDSDIDHRCDECADIADDIMTNYVKHKRSLKSKQRYKSKSKDPLLFCFCCRRSGDRQLSSLLCLVTADFGRPFVVFRRFSE